MDRLQAVVADIERAGGAVESELPLGIAFAIEQPADVDINEILLRPTAQEL